MADVVEKKKRTNLTEIQHQVLLCFFRARVFPDPEQRMVLSRFLNMAPRAVQVWFQNQRQKTKATKYHLSRTGPLDTETPAMHLDDKVSRKRSLNVLVNLASLEYANRNDSPGQQ